MKQYVMHRSCKTMGFLEFITEIHAAKSEPVRVACHTHKGIYIYIYRWEKLT